MSALNGNRMTGVAAHGLDLNAPGAIAELLEFHRKHFGDAVMSNNDDSNDNTGDDGGDGDELDGLLNDEANNNGDDDSSNDNGGDNGNDGALSAEDIARIVESAIDRRLNTPRMRARNNGGSNGGTNRRGNTERQQQTQHDDGPVFDSSDVREARAVYREYIADQVKFLGAPERDHALALADERIRVALERGDDPNRVGRDVATSVAESVKNLRSMYEKRTVAALRSKGLLPEKGSTGTGQPVRTNRTAAGSAGSKWANGQSRAAAMGRSKSATKQ